MTNHISRRRFLGTSAAAIAASSLPHAASVAATGDKLRIRVVADIVNVDPGFWQNTGDLWTMDAIFPRLINFKPGTKWQWELYSAESIEAVDAQHINFKLRPGLMWSNGYGEMTSEDVKYSFERYLDTDLAAPNAGNWALLDRVDVHDKYSGTIVFKEPFSPVWWFVLPYATGTIVCKKAVEEAGGKFSLEPPAMGGPYTLKEHVPSQLLVLEAHDGWNGPKPDFKTVEIYPISDSKAAENAVQAGQLDFTRVSLSIVPYLRENMPDGLVMELRATPDNVWLGLNQASPKLSDIRVRQAIMKAIDVEAILEGAYFGVGRARPWTGRERPARLSRRSAAGARRGGREAAARGSGGHQSRHRARHPGRCRLHDRGADRAGQPRRGRNQPADHVPRGRHILVPGRNQGQGGHRDGVQPLALAPPDLSWTTQWLLPEQIGIWNWQWFESPEFTELHFAAMAETDDAKRHELLVKLQDSLDASGDFLWITQPPRPMVWRDHVIPAMKPSGDPPSRAVQEGLIDGTERDPAQRRVASLCRAFP